MNIIKFTYKGKDVRNDIHYEKDHNLLRFGSDEEEKSRLRKTMNELNTKAAELARIPGVIVKRVNWSRPDGSKTEVKLECIAAAMNGDDMKINLPKIGYQELIDVSDFGESRKVKKPIKTDEDTMKLLIELEECLKDYIVEGAGQLKFSFEEDVREVVSI